jgi:hypothetical protein
MVVGIVVELNFPKPQYEFDLGYSTPLSRACQRRRSPPWIYVGCWVYWVYYGAAYGERIVGLEHEGRSAAVVEEVKKAEESAAAVAWRRD